jgi:hypothetical protein
MNACKRQVDKFVQVKSGGIETIILGGIFKGIEVGKLEVAFAAEFDGSNDDTVPGRRTLASLTTEHTAAKTG